MWCAGTIEQLWRVRAQEIAADERDEAHRTFLHAIAHYRRIAAEAPEKDEAVYNKIAIESIDAGREIIQKEKQANASNYVKLIHADTGKVLAIAGNSDDAGAKAVLARDDGSIAHQWSFEKQGDYYKIVNRKSAKVLDVQFGSTEEWVAIIQWDDHEKEGDVKNDNQLWSWDGKDKARRLRSKLSTLVLDVGLDDLMVQRKANEKAKGQLWRMVEIEVQQK